MQNVLRTCSKIQFVLFTELYEPEQSPVVASKDTVTKENMIEGTLLHCLIDDWKWKDPFPAISANIQLNSFFENFSFRQAS